MTGASGTIINDVRTQTITVNTTRERVGLRTEISGALSAQRPLND